jgi:hypothetical protein
VSLLLAVLGVTELGVAVWFERKMQRHRQPGVTYADATLRRDGGWRNASLFTEQGLRYQRLASSFGVAGTLSLVAALASWILLRNH